MGRNHARNSRACACRRRDRQGAASSARCTGGSSSIKGWTWGNSDSGRGLGGEGCGRDAGAHVAWCDSGFGESKCLSMSRPVYAGMLSVYECAQKDRQDILGRDGRLWGIGGGVAEVDRDGGVRSGSGLCAAEGFLVVDDV